MLFKNPSHSKAREWRDRADEYRAYADQARTPEGQRSYREVSENCARMAEMLEKLERSGLA